jgi:hypothetical protein
MATIIVKILLNFFCASPTAILASSLIRPILPPPFFPPNALLFFPLLLFYAISIPVLFGKLLRPIAYVKNEKGEYVFSLKRYLPTLFITTFIVYFILAFLVYYYTTKVICFVKDFAP